MLPMTQRYEYNKPTRRLYEYPFPDMGITYDIIRATQLDSY